MTPNYTQLKLNHFLLLSRTFTHFLEVALTDGNYYQNLLSTLSSL